MSQIPWSNWTLWLFPVFAVIFTALVFFEAWRDRGPMITLRFSDASSVEAQKTPLRFRGIKVGTVESVELSKDTTEVVVKARLVRSAKDLATEGSRFWIVQPQVDFEGVRGLETLFKGPYIRVEPGKGKPKLEFAGHTGDSLAENNVGTVSYVLESGFAESVDAGDPIFYRGLKVGAVAGVRLTPTAQGVEINIHIEKKFAKLVRSNTSFWQKSGVHANLGLFNSEIRVGSLENLLKGGISFATPNEAGPAAKANDKFRLTTDAPKDWIHWVPKLQ